MLLGIAANFIESSCVEFAPPELSTTKLKFLEKLEFAGALISTLSTKGYCLVFVLVVCVVAVVVEPERKFV